MAFRGVSSALSKYQRIENRVQPAGGTQLCKARTYEGLDLARMMDIRAPNWH